MAYSTGLIIKTLSVAYSISVLKKAFRSRKARLSICRCLKIWLPLIVAVLLFIILCWKPSPIAYAVTSFLLRNDVGFHNFRRLFEEDAVKYGPSFQRQYGFQLRDDDVFIVGALKTGTTWIQQIIHQIRSKGNMDFQNIYDVTWLLPLYFMRIKIGGNGYYNLSADQPYSPRIFKSHELYESIPKGKGIKYVVIVRDPMDAQLSFIKFSQGFFGGGTRPQTPLASLVMNVHSKAFKYSGSCSTYMIASWWPHRNDPNVLWIHYEDLAKDLSRGVRRIASFLRIALNETEEARVIGYSSYAYMSKHKEKFQLHPTMLAKGQGLKLWAANYEMVRSGGGRTGQGEKEVDLASRIFLRHLWRKIITNTIGYRDYTELYQNTSHWLR